MRPKDPETVRESAEGVAVLQHAVSPSRQVDDFSGIFISSFGDRQCRQRGPVPRITRL
jgi:hypothetical protein